MAEGLQLENHYVTGDLERAVSDFAENFNRRRYYEALNNLTPADVYFGRATRVLKAREEFKRNIFAQRRKAYFNQAA